VRKFIDIINEALRPSLVQNEYYWETYHHEDGMVMRYLKRKDHDDVAEVSYTPGKPAFRAVEWQVYPQNKDGFGTCQELAKRKCEELLGLPICFDSEIPRDEVNGGFIYPGHNPVYEALNPKHAKPLAYWSEHRSLGTLLVVRGQRSYAACINYDDNVASRSYGKWIYFFDLNDMKLANSKEEAMAHCEQALGVTVGPAPVKEALNPMHAKPRYFWRRFCGALYLHPEGLPEREIAGVNYGGDNDMISGRLATRYLYWVDDRKTVECSGDEATEEAAQRHHLGIRDSRVAMRAHGLDRRSHLHFIDVPQESARQATHD
jgi:hypothetical protein